MIAPPSKVYPNLPHWAEPLLYPAPYKSLSGGRGTGKSHGFSELSVLHMADLMREYGYEGGAVRIACARETKEAIQESVKVSVEAYISALDLEDEFDVGNYRIKHENGSRMFFPGIGGQNAKALMSLESVDFFWVEQAETAQPQWMEKVIPSIRKPRAERWFSWNPESRASWSWQRFVIRPRPTDIHIHTTYQDNPWWYPICTECWQQRPWSKADSTCEDCGGYVTPGLRELEDERLECKHHEPERYAHVWLGEPDDADGDKTVLPYAVLEECVKAYKAGLAPESYDRVDAGLDIGEGGRDKCSLVIRKGPIVDSVDTWAGVVGDLGPAARRAHETYAPIARGRLYYDGAHPIKADFRRLGTRYRTMAINFGGAVGGADVSYEYNRPNGEVFTARNIQMADNLRLRANRTVRLMKGEDINPRNCLFINPAIKNLEGFLAVLTGPIRRVVPATGKWELDKRGGDEKAKSPDEFDALCLAFARDSDNGLKARL